MDLPVQELLPQLGSALAGGMNAVLVAPPGAGKTTLVPLFLMRQPWAEASRIILVEPRRIAARAAARRMAAMLGEPVGETVGFRVRLESRSSSRTRILVVTDGVFSRMALDDPELAGTAAVLFDEFHERSLDCDFGLALALDIQRGLREDLRLLAMSATLDGVPVASLMGGAPILESAGRSHPVSIEYHPPRQPGEPIEVTVAAAIRQALTREHGSILAFLPGQGEVARTYDRIAGALPGDADLMPLHGGLDGAAQDAAIRPPAAGRRKIVLATSIAESSITIEGVRVVIDSGLARLPRFDPASGLTRLETVRVSRASADQRAGRAGRTEPGIAWRLWHENANASLSPAPPPEILASDLTDLVLDCAAAGIADPAILPFLDAPPKPALQAARRRLVALGALDGDGTITATGRAMRGLGLPAPLALMVSEAAKEGHALAASELAVLISERGLGGSAIDLERRLEAFRKDRGARARNAAGLARQLARRAGDRKRATSDARPGALLLHAFPDRIAQARGQPGEFRLANGSGAHVPATDPLAGEPLLVVAELAGRPASARITAAAPIDAASLERLMADRIERRSTSWFDRASGTVRRREQRRIGAILLSEGMLAPPQGAEADEAIVAAIREHGLDILPWSTSARDLHARLAWLQRELGPPWPAMDEASLIATLEDWLQPFLSGSPALASLGARVLEQALFSRVPFEHQGSVERLAPSHYLAPSGSRIRLRYEEDGPVLAVRVQELYGLDQHPAIGGGRVPLKLELLSPAGRPIQTTRDLPAFWRGSWADVRAQMRGRYPRHPWPERPELATPTSRAKPRGQ